MQQIFVNDSPVNNCFSIKGEDFFHLSKVVRLKEGEQLRVSTADEESYLCKITQLTSDEIKAEIISKTDSSELPARIYLFQALPKGDRMETIIEKCVELGVYEIIPVQMKNCIVKLDDKKKQLRINRYQTIASTAAKQSKRSIVPNIHQMLDFKDALSYARDNCNLRILPYENQNGMSELSELESYIRTTANVNNDNEKLSIAVFIGPEGGFDTSEIAQCDDFRIVSLGQRILRTDTAAICTVSYLMLLLELSNNN